MQRFGVFSFAIIISLLIVVAGLLHALKQHPPYARQIDTEQQADGKLNAHQVGSEGRQREDQPKARQGEEEGTEFWPAFLGYRLKVTDTLVAAFTALLFFATIALWLATRRLVTGAEQTAERQLRAFVFAKGFSSRINLEEDEPGNFRVGQYLFFFSIENVGLTPAQDLRCYFSTEALPKNEDVEPSFTPSGNSVSIVLGPRSESRSGYITIEVDELVRCWCNEIEIYIWSRIEYRDFSAPEILRHHEQCARLQFIHDPSEIPRSKDHPSYVMFNMYGPQNTSS